MSKTMKGLSKRILSFVLMLVMVVGMMPGMSVRVEAADFPTVTEVESKLGGVTFYNATNKTVLYYCNNKIHLANKIGYSSIMTSILSCAISDLSEYDYYLYDDETKVYCKLESNNITEIKTEYDDGSEINWNGIYSIVSDEQTISKTDFLSKIQFDLNATMEDDGETYTYDMWVADGELMFGMKAESFSMPIDMNSKVVRVADNEYLFGNKDYGGIYAKFKTSGAIEKITMGNMEFIPILPEHTHHWTYKADGTTLKAYCTETEGAEECSYQGSASDLSNAVSLTLSATSQNYSGSAYTGASLGDTSAWTTTGLLAPIVKYEGRGNTAYVESTTAPTKPGTYIVKVYPEANPVIIVTKDFEIKRKAPETDVDKIIDMDDTTWTYQFFKNGRYRCYVYGDDKEKGRFENILFYNISGFPVSYGGPGITFGDTNDADYSETPITLEWINDFITGIDDGAGVKITYNIVGDTRTVSFSQMLHSHIWNYSADGNKIEVYCSKNDGDCYLKTYETDKIALTLNAESQTVSQKEAYTGASLENLEAFMEAIELDEEPTIEYFKVDAKGATTGGSKVEAAKVRATVGNYYAAVTIADESDNEYTAVKAFEIKNDTATKYDTIVTKEFDTGNNKKGITIGLPGGETGTNLNGIVTVNAKLKVTMLDSEWTPTGYVLSRVTPDNLEATKWVSVSGNKVEQKNLKKLAAFKYNKKKNQTLINLKQNKKVSGAVYAIRLEDGKGNTICMNIECIELDKDIKKSALKINTIETAPTAEAMLAMADGDSAKSIGLTMLGSKTHSEFNSNAVTWVIGSGKKAVSLKKGEVKTVADKSGKPIAYLTIADNGTVKVVSGTVKGKVKLTGVVNRKAYKTTVTVK